MLYGDVRPIHAEAVARAKAAGIMVHVFEEGYLRPYWVTYERGGSNGHSRLMEMSVRDRCARRWRTRMWISPCRPASWGDMRQHIFYGAVYHGFVLLANRRYRNFARTAASGCGRNSGFTFNRLLLMPAGAGD